MSFFNDSYFPNIKDFLNESGYSKYIKDFERNGFYTLKDIGKYDKGENLNTLTKIKETIGDNDDVGKLYHLIMDEYNRLVRKRGLTIAIVFFGVMIFIFIGLPLIDIYF
tara:strand:- start:382 stop:708 length:327 start_codon:yes stop_codon:yes gene_type:complete